MVTRSGDRQGPAHYRFRVDGHLDQHWSSWFGDLTLTHHEDATTSLTGAVADQAELHGLLIRIRDLGVTLISVETVDPPQGPGGAAAPYAEHDAAGGRRTAGHTTPDET